MSVYKDHLFAAQCRLEQLRCIYPQATIIPQDLERTYAHCMARIWAGIIGIIGFIVLVLSAIYLMARGSNPVFGFLFLAIWMAMALTYSTTLGLAKFHLHWFVRKNFAPSKDLFIDLALLEAGGPTGWVLTKTKQLFKKSLALPLTALSLITPLSLHLLFCLFFLPRELKDFHQWAFGSLIFVGHAHLALVILSIIYVKRLLRELDVKNLLEEIAPNKIVNGAYRGLIALLWTTGISALPGLLLLVVAPIVVFSLYGLVVLALPPLLVFLTGIIFVPWMFAWAERRAYTERSCLQKYSSANSV